jgi:hypothetical protein
MIKLPVEFSARVTLVGYLEPVRMFRSLRAVYCDVTYPTPTSETLHFLYVHQDALPLILAVLRAPCKRGKKELQNQKFIHTL